VEDRKQKRKKWQHGVVVVRDVPNRGVGMSRKESLARKRVERETGSRPKPAARPKRGFETRKFSNARPENFGRRDMRPAGGRGKGKKKSAAEEHKPALGSCRVNSIIVQFAGADPENNRLTT